MICLRNVSAGYSGKSFLSIPFLDLSNGIITLAGENGSGKSTLLKTILGLVPHTGSLLVDGQNPSALQAKKRAALLAYLPQENPVPDMTVRMLASHGRFSRMNFSRRMTAEDIAAVDRALLLTEMAAFADRNLLTLSGGERKRAWLSMVIAQDTPYLLLDEPGAGLDVRHQLELGEILCSLRDLGHTILLASHDLPQSFAISDRICLIKGGAILADGSPTDLVRQPDLLEQGLHLHLIPVANPDSLYPYLLAKS